MSTNIDFKTLWNKQNINTPDMNEIFEKAGRLRRKTLIRIWVTNVMLSLTVVLVTFVLIDTKSDMITTKIGICLMIIAMVMYLIVSNQLLPLVNKIDMSTDSKRYLSGLIRIKHKQEFLNTTIATIYFAFLSLGLALNMVEYLSKVSSLFKILAYASTFVWMAICWFYLNPKTSRKQRNTINGLIEKLEAVNEQLKGEV
jgi:hypothetical protein